MAEIKAQVLTPDLADIASSAIARPSVEPANELPSSYPDATLFTFLPELYLVITRLKELREPPPYNPLDEHDLTQTVSRDSTKITSDASAEPIEVREIPAAVYSIRRGITAAKEIVRELPDGDRSIQQQNMEIKQLEREIKALETRLEHISRIAEVADMDVPIAGIK